MAATNCGSAGRGKLMSECKVMTEEERFMLDILNRMFTPNSPKQEAFNVLYTRVWPFTNPIFEDAVRAMRARGCFFTDRKTGRNLIHVFNWEK